MNKISILAPNKEFFGATIVQIPFYQALRKTYPNAKIHVWTKVSSLSIIKKFNPKLIDHLHFDEKNSSRGLIKEIRDFSPDIFINMRPFSLRSSIVAKFISCSIKISFSQKEQGKSRYQVFQNTKKYIAYSYLDLLKPLSIDSPLTVSIESVDFKAPLSLKPSIALIVGAGESFKRWGIHNFLSYAQLMTDHYNFHFILGKDEIEHQQQIEKMNQPHFHLHVGESVQELVSLCNQVDLIISNDCGPSHIAQMSDTPYIGLWSWGIGKKALFPRFSEWHYPRPYSYPILPHFGLEVSEIKVEEILKISRGLLSQ